jgi:hypothetical protein
LPHVNRLRFDGWSGRILRVGPWSVGSAERAHLDEREPLTRRVDADLLASSSFTGFRFPPGVPNVCSTTGGGSAEDMATSNEPGRTNEQVARRPDKDPDDWTTGDEPMTGAQESYLHTLAQEADDDSSSIPADLTKAEASKLIDELQQRTGRGND